GQTADLHGRSAFVLRGGACSRIGVHRSREGGFWTRSAPRSRAELAERSVHRSLLRVLPMEHVSECSARVPAAGVAGLQTHQDALHRQELRRELGREGLPGRERSLANLGRGGRCRANPKLVALLMTGIALSVGLADSRSASAQSRTPAAERIAPDFSRVDLDGKKIRLSSFRGKVVLLNFWATWCAPCLAEMPRFVEWQQKYGPRGLQIVGVSMDDEEAPVRAMYRRLRLNYPVVMGDEKVGELYGGILGLPVTFLIDREGKIRFQHDGETRLEVIEREIQELLPRP